MTPLTARITNKAMIPPIITPCLRSVLSASWSDESVSCECSCVVIITSVMKTSARRHVYARGYEPK